IKTDVKQIDEYLRGGIAIGRITELIGMSGTGKTQMWQLCLNVQIPKNIGGLEGKALYVDTKRDFSPARLQELAIDMERRFLHATLGNFKTKRMLENVYHVNCPSPAQLIACIFNLHRYVNYWTDIRLIVVDSLAFSIRMLENVSERTQLLMELHAYMRQLLTKFSVAVVLTNELGYYKHRRKWEQRPILGNQHTLLINERIWLTGEGYYIGKTLKHRKLIASIN
ncbi:hypothetical protein KR044_004250, partial [Drosophila immigrans]